MEYDIAAAIRSNIPAFYAVTVSWLRVIQGYVMFFFVFIETRFGTPHPIVWIGEECRLMSFNSTQRAAIIRFRAYLLCCLAVSFLHRSIAGLYLVGYTAQYLRKVMIGVYIAGGVQYR